jgi:hypothetical protein
LGWYRPGGRSNGAFLEWEIVVIINKLPLQLVKEVVVAKEEDQRPFQCVNQLVKPEALNSGKELLKGLMV